MQQDKMTIASNSAPIGNLLHYLPAPRHANMPQGRFRPTSIESLSLNVAARILRNSLAKPLKILHEDHFVEDLSEEMHRSSLLLSMAEKGNDDASQTNKVAFQTLLDWKNIVDAVRQAEKKMKDLIPTLSGSNDELFEKLTSREEWYLRCDFDCKSLLNLMP